jgi:hypothetical protein
MFPGIKKRSNMPVKVVIALAYIIFYLGSEIASAVVGLRTMRKTWPSWYKLLVIMCWFTVVVETLHIVLLFRGVRTYATYNTLLSVETFILVYALYREATLRSIRRLLLVLLIVLPVGLAVCFSFPSGFTNTNNAADTVELIIELMAACAVLIDMLQDMSGASLFSSPRFWLAAGTLGSSCMFALMIASRKSLEGDPMEAFYEIPYSCVANTFLYGGIITCFIMLKRAQKGRVKVNTDPFPSEESTDIFPP